MDLVPAMRGQYYTSEKLLWASTTIKCLMYVMTFISVIWTTSRSGGVFLCAAFVGQLILFALHVSTNKHLSVAQQLRRCAMLEDGIGKNLAPLDNAVLAEKVWSTPQQPILGPYYSSCLPKGPKRLIEITAECAFFSGSIGQAAWTAFLGASVVATLTLMTCLILAVMLHVQQSGIDLIAKVVLIGITFWMTEDIIDMAVKYRSVAISCQRVLQQCSHLLSANSCSTEDAYLALAEYDVAVSNAPPLPSLIYKRRNERLSDIWRQTHSLRTTATSNQT